VRPEHIDVAAGSDGGLPATLEQVEQLGATSYLYATLPGGQTLTVQRPGQSPARRHEAVGLVLDPDRCHVFAGGEGAAALPPL
jgi:ABC-type sugar transport system ATPase subunit